MDLLYHHPAALLDHVVRQHRKFDGNARVIFLIGIDDSSRIKVAGESDDDVIESMMW